VQPAEGSVPLHVQVRQQQQVLEVPADTTMALTNGTGTDSAVVDSGTSTWLKRGDVRQCAHSEVNMGVTSVRPKFMQLRSFNASDQQMTG
jgi:hypothetical protein